MIVYEVNLEVDNEIADEFDAWLAAERMRADGVERFGSRFRASRRVLAPLTD